jgi:hypothetical protein
MGFNSWLKGLIEILSRKLEAFHLESRLKLKDSKMTRIMFIPSGKATRTTTETERDGE